MESGPPSARLCHIVKWEDFDGYGFNLHAEKGKSGQFIGKVDEGSPSEAAGLRQGDRIIEVNEINIANETHKQVVERIKAFPNETKLLVVDQMADDYYKAANLPIKGTMPGVRYMKTPERQPCDEVDEKSNGSHKTSDTHSISSSELQAQSENGDEMKSTSMNNDNNKQQQQQSNGNAATLNLAMSAKELRAKLAMRKKYDPKKESLPFKDKFDIVQKL